VTSTSRTLRIAVAAIVVAAILVVVGRWEGARSTRAEAARIDEVVAAAGPIDGQKLVGYRLAELDCLLYRAGKNPYALELCFDPRGRLVEALDRRKGGDPRIGTLRYDPGAAPVVVPPERLLSVFRSVGALRSRGLVDGSMPSGFADVGPRIDKPRYLRSIGFDPS
jgi:hypothetical protein